ncbi:MAG: hypothetical protein Q8M57_03225 [Nitrosomonas sp.]|nr:hypothetical protein [Nitrosomonas sp.]MDO8895849.1 hypothetical protein [Nitrosomonas sp.]MDP3280056.1 hypothetical protein [Nitrosomonas sp.]
MKNKKNLLQQYYKSTTASINSKISELEINHGYIELLIIAAYFSVRG